MKSLASRRKAAGYTQVEFAARLGVSQAAVAGWESGESYPSADKLPTIAEVLGCSIDELFADPAVSA